MTNLSKREGVMVIVLSIAICGALYYNLVFKPFLAKNEEISTRITDTQTTLNDFKVKKASIIAVDKKLLVINTEMGENLERVLDSIDNPGIIVMLNKILPPIANTITLGFSPSYKDLGNSYITTVETSFLCNQEGFRQILENLSKSEYENRVINSYLKVVDPVTNSCEARISIEILTKSIIPTKTEFTYSLD